MCLPHSVEWGEKHVRTNNLLSPVAPDGLLPRSCAFCVNDAGYQSGMAGASRCALIERAQGHAFAGPDCPREWRREPNGVISCSDFIPDVAEN